MHTLVFPLVLLAAGPASQASDFSGDPGVCRKLPFAQHLYVNLESLVTQADVHANTCVRTKGRLRLHGRAKEQGDALRGPLMLMLEDPESGESVSVSPREKISEQFNEDALSLVGLDIEVAGRFIVGPPHWISFSGYEVTPVRAGRRPHENLSACDVVGSPGVYLGQRVVVWAPFRGRNLFRDLPDETRPDATAWVVGDEDCAVWITGHPPAGKGFSFDAPAPDVRWLKVEGKVQRRGATVLVKASKVALATPRD